MQKIVKYKTNDGTEHNSLIDAEKYLEKCYGDTICRIAQDIAGLDGKYEKILHYLDKHTANFCYMIEVKKEKENGLDYKEDE